MDQSTGQSMNNPSGFSVVLKNSAELVDWNHGTIHGTIQCSIKCSKESSWRCWFAPYEDLLKVFSVKSEMHGYVCKIRKTFTTMCAFVNLFLNCKAMFCSTFATSVQNYCGLFHN